MENLSYPINPRKSITKTAVSQPHTITSFHEIELRNQILDTHDHHELEFGTKHVLNIVEIILRRSIQELPGLINQESPSYEDVEMITLDSHAKDITEVQRAVTSLHGKICCNWSEGRDSHATTMDILHMIKRYEWDAKAVLALATLATSFGSFHLAEQLRFTNPLAKAVSQLSKPLPERLGSDEASKPKLKALSLLVTATLDSTKSVVELYELLGNEYLAERPDVVDSTTSDVPTAIYWTIRSTVDCSSQIYVLASVGPEYLLDPWELSSTAHKLEKIRSQILEKINFCCRYIENKRDDEALEAITRVLETSHVDNSKSLDIMFRKKDGHEQPLYDCLQQHLVSVAVLRHKVVGLYITDLDIVTKDYLILQQVYPENLDDESRVECQYEIVWYPIVDNWTNEKKRRFESLRDQMEWLSVSCPTDMSPQVIRYIKEKCGYVKKPLILAMDTEGKIVHKDALSMMCIWGNRAYPFSLDRERLLWQQTTWSIHLLAEGIDQFMPDWINTAGKHICLYGGEDIEWIRRFTREMRRVSRDSGIDLELLYVGKDRARERVVRKIINVVRRENLSDTLDWGLVNYFWLRLEKICISDPPEICISDLPEIDGLGAPVRSPETYNPIVSGAVRMLSVGSSGRGWAAISDVGPAWSVVLEAEGEALVRALGEHEKWKGSEESYGFATALTRHYHSLCNDYAAHCVNVVLSETGLDGVFSCAVCNSPMEKMVMYSCCSDKSSFGYYDYE